MPKTGHGVTYWLGAEKMLPIKGHHYLDGEIGYGGTHYWDQSDYRERTLRVSAGYVYQRYGLWEKAAPFFERNWLGGEVYGKNAGLSLALSKNIGDKQVFAPYAAYAEKRYDKPQLARYEGWRAQLGATWLYAVKANWRVSAGMDYVSDQLEDETESSHTWAMRLGTTHHWQNGLNGQINLRAGKRRFDAPHFLFGTLRRDKEYSGSIGLWHDKVSYKGLTPKLVYQYHKIDSNLPALYSWQSQGLNVEIVKQF